MIEFLNHLIVSEDSSSGADFNPCIFAKEATKESQPFSQKEVKFFLEDMSVGIIRRMCKEQSDSDQVSSIFYSNIYYSISKFVDKFLRLIYVSLLLVSSKNFLIRNFYSHVDSFLTMNANSIKSIFRFLTTSFNACILKEVVRCGEQN
jgi:hypothetical protein